MTTSSGSSGSKRKSAASSVTQHPPNRDDNPELQGSDILGTAIITGFTFGQKALQYAAVDGRAIFEGDIDLGSIDEVEAANAAFRGEDVAEAAVITGSQFRWPNARIPYEIDPAMPDQQRVTDAIAHWEAHTAIRFILRTPLNAATFPNYVHFFHGSGCSSQVGMRGGRQNISLGTGCDAGRAIHEIGHAVGLWHEQSREDRDSFVVIHWQNIQDGKEFNFNQHISDGDDVGPYDYGSIMHYERTAFSKNGSATITPTNPATAHIGQRVALSAGDIAAVASMYGAPPSKPGLKKVADDPIGFKKVADDTSTKPIRDLKQPFKKSRDDVQIKKIADDVPVLPGWLRPGLAPFLMSTGHHFDVAADVGAAGVGAAGVEIDEAAAVVDQARRNVIALQTALTGATTELAHAQDRLQALLGALPSTE